MNSHLTSDDSFIFLLLFSLTSFLDDCVQRSVLNKLLLFDDLEGISEVSEGDH